MHHKPSLTQVDLKPNTKANMDTGSTVFTKPVVTKTPDGTIQITLTIPFADILTGRKLALAKIGQRTEVPGFRKGMAPVEKVAERVSPETLLQETLGEVLPKRLADALTENKINPATYPKLELLKNKDGEDWEIRATTCELPVINLGDYKTALSGELKASQIWTPEKGTAEDKKTEETKRVEKERAVIRFLLEKITISIPAMLIEDEVNARLSSLLQRTEKLGLNLEAYLANIGKTPESIRGEYQKEAEAAIKLDLILGKIAMDDNIQADKTKIPPTKDPEQAMMYEAILRRRGALDSLMALL